MSRRWSMKSKSIEKVRVSCGMGWVVGPQGVTYIVTCQEWFVHGDCISRIFPTTWLQRWRVAYVSRQPAKGSGGQASSMAPGDTLHATPPIAKRAFGRLRQRSRMLVNLGLLQEHIARLVPDHDAVVWGDRVWSHADVAAGRRGI